MRSAAGGKILRSRSLIYGGLIVILLFNCLLRWRLADLPLERDEGEYAYSGQLILQGIPPYQLAYNMKFPGAYYAYALLMAIFGESARGIHYGIALVTSLTAIFNFLIGRKLFGSVGGLVAAATYVLLSLSAIMLGLAGHATHFVALCVTLGTWFLLKATQTRPALWCAAGGAAFGLAVLMKQHAIFFIPLAFLWLVLAGRKIKTPDKLIVRNGLLFGIGSVLPFAVVFVVLLCSGVAKQFLFWTFTYASSYVSINTFPSAGEIFLTVFARIFRSTGAFWLLGFAGFVTILVRRRRDPFPWLPILLFLGGMLAVVPGFYFTNHYFLAATPGLALLNAALFKHPDPAPKPWPARWTALCPALLILLAIFTTTHANRAPWFTLSPNQVSRKIYKLNPFIESPAIAEFVRNNTSPNDPIAVLGSEPQIYFLAKRHSATGYIYTYSLTEANELSSAMREQFIREMETAKPVLVVYVNLVSSWMATSDREKSVLDWWQNYSSAYRLVGAVDEFENEPSKFYWNAQLNERTNPSPVGILVYQRIK